MANSADSQNAAINDDSISSSTLANEEQQLSERGGFSPTTSQDFPVLTDDLLSTPKPRRRWLPLILFFVTCLSTFIAGATSWNGLVTLGDGLEFRRTIMTHWQQGLIYMGCVLAILGLHEMGHFLATIRYRISASFPFFIPFPVSPIGTMGAVIGMAGHRADRKQMFDIGIAGPLAGLVVAIPILWIGIRNLDMTIAASGPYQLDLPWIVKAMISWQRPDLQSISRVSISQLNPYFMAAWVGLLITGLNMMPVSQLDGGHVIYALLLKRGHWVARIFLLSAIAYVVLARVGIWSVMLILVTLMGVDHPPTSNDRVPLGWFRTVLGWASLSIPFLCFPARGLIM